MWMVAHDELMTFEQWMDRRDIDTERYVQCTDVDDVLTEG